VNDLREPVDRLHDERNAALARVQEFERTIADLRNQLRETEHQRDLAIAHDSQPYPTQWAYEQACAALDATKERERALIAERDTLLRKFDAAITRLQAELDRNRRLNDYDRHDLWLRDIIKDLNA
jgi:chromosome segregation ATPase